MFASPSRSRTRSISSATARTSAWWSTSPSSTNGCRRSSGVEAEHPEVDYEADQRQQPADLPPHNVISFFQNSFERKVRGHGLEAREIRIRLFAKIHENRAQRGDDEQAAEEDQRLHVATREDVRHGPEHEGPHDRMARDADHASRGLLAFQ